MSLPVWSKYGRIYSINPNIASQRIDFDCLQITEREVGAFAKIFENFGYFGKNQQQSTQLIDIEKIISKLKLQRTNFHSRIFTTSQQSSEQFGQISFHDLLLVIWNICTIDLLSLGFLLFDIYDLDQSGTFEFDEVKLLISELCDGVVLNSNDANLVNSRLDELNYLAVSSEVFVGLCRSYPVILQPLKNVQQCFKSYFNISKDFWDRQITKRLQMTDNEYVSLQSLLDQQASLLGLTRQRYIDITHTLTGGRKEGVIQSAVRDSNTSHLPGSNQNDKLPPLNIISYTNHSNQLLNKNRNDNNPQTLQSNNSLSTLQLPTPTFRDYIADLKYAIRKDKEIERQYFKENDHTSVSLKSSPVLSYHVGKVYKNNWRYK